MDSYIPLPPAKPVDSIVKSCLGNDSKEPDAKTHNTMGEVIKETDTVGQTIAGNHLHAARQLGIIPDLND